MNNRINRAIRFYYEESEEVYTEAYIRRFNLDNNIYPEFNPVQPAVNTLTSLTLQQIIEHNASDESQKKFIDDLWTRNKIQTVKYQLLIDMLLYRYAVIHITEKGGNVSFVRVLPDTVMFEKETGELISVTIQGSKKEIKNGVVFIKQISRKYYKEENKFFVVDDDGQPLPIISGVLPVVVMETNYNLNHLLDITDSINNKTVFLNNIYEMHGNPILNLQQGGQIKDKTIVANDGLKMLQTDGNLSYVEMVGNVASMIMKYIESMEERVSIEYPESALSRVLSGSNISENTSMIRFADLESKVNKLRGEFGNGLVEVTNKALLMAGKGSVEDLAIKFESVFPKQNNYDDEVKIVDLAIKYKELANQKLFNEYRTRVDLPIFDDGNAENGSEWQDFINGKAGF